MLQRFLVMAFVCSFVSGVLFLPMLSAVTGYVTIDGRKYILANDMVAISAPKNEKKVIFYYRGCQKKDVKYTKAEFGGIWQIVNKKESITYNKEGKRCF